MRGPGRSSGAGRRWRAVGARLALGLTLVAATTVATVPLATSAGAADPAITAVTFSGTPAAPSITYWGSGFGTESDLGAASPAACDYSGSDYGTTSISPTTAGRPASVRAVAVTVSV